MEVDFDLGCIIKDKLIPYAHLWFTGEAAEYEDDGFDMGGGESISPFVKRFNLFKFNVPL